MAREGTGACHTVPRPANRAHGSRQHDRAAVACKAWRPRSVRATLPPSLGVVAQLGERLNRIQEVVSSILIHSTLSATARPPAGRCSFAAHPQCLLALRRANQNLISEHFQRLGTLGQRASVPLPAIISSCLPQIHDACRRAGARSLRTFGSAASGTRDSASGDVDLLADVRSALAGC
jgi:hypothetical protein